MASTNQFYKQLPRFSKLKNFSILLLIGFINNSYQSSLQQMNNKLVAKEHLFRENVQDLQINLNKKAQELPQLSGNKRYDLQNQMIFEATINDFNPKQEFPEINSHVKQLQSVNRELVQATSPTYEDWGQFTMGALLGASVELSTQVSNVCISNIATLFQSAYLVYFYMNNYLATDSTQAASYAFTYILKLFRTGLSFDCSAGISFASRNAFNTRLNQKQSQSHTSFINKLQHFKIYDYPFVLFDFILQQTNAQDLQGIIEILIQILGDAQEAIGLAEIVIDTATVQAEWEDGDYFEAELNKMLQKQYSYSNKILICKNWSLRRQGSSKRGIHILRHHKKIHVDLLIFKTPEQSQQQKQKTLLTFIRIIQIMRSKNN